MIYSAINCFSIHMFEYIEIFSVVFLYKKIYICVSNDIKAA